MKSGLQDRQKRPLCIQCGNRLVSRREDHHYTLSGLSNIILENIEMRDCPNCGESEIVIQKIEQLHRTIALTIAGKKGLLAPEEIRFLRKYLGWSGVDFAAYFGATPETVSRWENGARSMGAQAERLLRLFSMCLEPVKDYSVLKQIDLRERKRKQVYRLILTDKWRIAA